MPRPSHRAQTIPPSPIRKLVPFADQAKLRGTRVFHLNIGQPDIETPKPMIDAFHRYDAKVLEYGASTGLLDLRKAVAADSQNRIQARLETDLSSLRGSPEFSEIVAGA